MHSYLPLLVSISEALMKRKNLTDYFILLQAVVIDEVDNFLFRPRLGLRSKYHAVCLSYIFIFFSHQFTFNLELNYSWVPCRSRSILLCITCKNEKFEEVKTSKQGKCYMK